MKKEKSRKFYILGSISFFAFIIFLTSLSVDNIDKESQFFDPIMNKREYVEHKKLIATKENSDGIMLYSVGKVNNGKDNMYFVDMVKRSFINYKWIGGGGHSNRDITKRGEDFILSAQLLNENQNVTPTLFGIFSDEKIDKISIITRDWQSNSVVYIGEGEKEKLYVIQFKNNVSNYHNFIFKITFKDGKRMDYGISEDEIVEFQKGSQIYLYENQLN